MDKRRLLALDKDGTLVRPASGSKFVQHPEDQVLLPGVAEVIRRYADEGWAMVICSNQGGVAAGHKTLEEAIAEMRYCLNLLPEINTAYFCPSLAPPKWLRWLRHLGFYATRCYRVDRDGRPLSAAEWFVDEDYILAGGDNTFGYRKPGGLMLFWAATEHLILADGWHENVLFVGDRPEDEGAANAAGVRFMWADDWRNSREP